MSLIGKLKGFEQRVAKPLERAANPVTQAVLGLAHAAEDRFEASVQTKLLGLGYPAVGALAARSQSIQVKVAEMKLGQAQQRILAVAYRLGVSPVDVWQGSHVVVTGDSGALFQTWRTLGATPRSSSHYPNVTTQQYEVTFGKHAFLFGKDPAGDTWFQMEGHAFDGLKDPLTSTQHLLDYAKYRLTHENVGPLGRSPHSEHNDPIRVPYLG
jgi:hypothetical protein